MRQPYDVAIIGAGFAGWAAAAGALEHGARVVLFDGGPGGSLFWSGLADVHGPPAPAPPVQDPHRLRRTPPAPVAAHRSIAERRAALSALFPAHPYERAGAGPDEVDRMLDAACAALGLSLDACGGSTFVTDAATLRCADRCVPGTARLAAGQRALVLGPASLGTFDPGWVARALTEGGLHANAQLIGDALPLCDTPARAQATGLAHSLLEAGALSDLCLDDVDVVLVPPIFSRDPEVADEQRSSWEQALGRPVRELSGTVDSPFGARAMTRIQTHTGGRVDVIRRTVSLTDAWDGARWALGDTTAHAAVVASGATFRSSAPAAAASDAEPTARSPWRPQPFLTGGLSVQPDGRCEALPGLAWAAGSCLSGHDPAHDGTAFGVALWSGYRAGCAAAQEVC